MVWTQKPNPLSFKLTNWVRPKMIWSSTWMSINLPASTHCFVTVTSSGLGDTSLLGWLWATMMAVATFADVAATGRHKPGLFDFDGHGIGAMVAYDLR